MLVCRNEGIGSLDLVPRESVLGNDRGAEKKKDRKDVLTRYVLGNVA